MLTIAIAKRFVELVICVTGLLALGPLMVVTAALIKFKLGSPIIFKQIRPGLNNKPFVIYKFKTMRETRNSNGQLQPDGLRLGKFGKFLRSTSIDELPELINVIKGDMSLVGPRPLLMKYLDLYTAEQARRHEVKPGITGWAQVNGRNALSWEKKFKFDVWYVDNRSVFLDIKIIMLTFKKVIKRECISQPGHSTAMEFKGSTDR